MIVSIFLQSMLLFVLFLLIGIFLLLTIGTFLGGGSWTRRW